jgi:hypothetical protein
LRRETLADVKRRAFDTNGQAKQSNGPDRDALYREKGAAISFLLEAGYAFVDSVDWSAADPTLGVTFVDGGRLHTKLSCLTSRALHSVRRQLKGRLTPDRATVARRCRDFRGRAAA